MTRKRTLRQLRTSKNWTLEQLKFESGVDISIVSKAENKLLSPNSVEKTKLAKAYGLKITDIDFPICILQSHYEQLRQTTDV